MSESPLQTQPIHSRNGHPEVSAQPCVSNQEKSSQTQDTIAPAAIPQMDLKKASIREVLEYLLRTGDSDAWVEFQNRIKRNIRGSIARRLGQASKDDVIDDLEQDTYAKLVANDYKALRKEFPEDLSVFSYVKVAATHVAIDASRKSDNKVFFYT